MRAILKRIVFGETLLPQEFTLGLAEPEREVSVWCHARNATTDVTARHTTACTAPLILCVAADEESGLVPKDCRTASLTFRPYARPTEVLGEIDMRLKSVVSAGDSRFMLFSGGGSSNYCLPRARLLAHHVHQAYAQFRRNDPPDIRMSLVEQRASAVTFIRPHPLCLASVGDEANGNIFPMNLMGGLGDGYFGFALREKRVAAHLVERAGRAAISNVPLRWCPAPFHLAGNHKKDSIDWRKLPFETKPSSRFGIPVPVFTARVREIEVCAVEMLGSHRFFVARIVSDEVSSPEPQACVVHGFYQFRRLEGDSARLEESVREDRWNKRSLEFVNFERRSADYSITPAPVP